MPDSAYPLRMRRAPNLRRRPWEVSYRDPRTTKSSLCPKCTVRCGGTEGTFSVRPHGRSWCQFAWPCAELASSNFWHAGSGAARRYSRRERTYTLMMTTTGKRDVNEPAMHRNSAREDVNGETGRNTRRKPKIIESSCVAVIVAANVCAIHERHCCERAISRSRRSFAILWLMRNYMLIDCSIIRDTAKSVVVIEIGHLSAVRLVWYPFMSHVGGGPRNAGRN